MPQFEDLEIVRRPVIHNGEKKMCQGMSARSVITALRESDADSVVMFAVALPNGQTMWAGVQGVICDFDGTGACTVLLDHNVARMIRGL
jgi:hypothetical protein